MGILGTVVGRAGVSGVRGLAVLASAAVAAALAVSPVQGQTLPWGGQASRVEADDVDPFYDAAGLTPGAPGVRPAAS